MLMVKITLYIKKTLSLKLKILSLTLKQQKKQHIVLITSLTFKP